MPRTADYAIQGFLYQFQVTLKSILEADADSKITIEGIIEDIEVEEGSVITATQCKYHESVENFTLSHVYKPLLQMMEHFSRNATAGISYKLYSHFPNVEEGIYNIVLDDLNTVLTTEDTSLKKIADKVDKNVIPQEFLKHFEMTIGPSYESISQENIKLLSDCGFESDSLETLTYPNAIHEIAHISINHDATNREISRKDFIEQLHDVRATAISKWTLALKSRKAVLTARKLQLKGNLSKNARKRYFLIHPESITSFDTDIVMFISDYLSKYHYKIAHVETPVFCFDAKQEEVDAILLRLHQKEITANTGIIAGTFDETSFFRRPMLDTTSEKPNVIREFSLCLLSLKENRDALNKRVCDDLFVLGPCDIDGLKLQDVCVEYLDTRSFIELRYLLGLSNATE